MIRKVPTILLPSPPALASPSSSISQSDSISDDRKPRCCKSLRWLRFCWWKVLRHFLSCLLSIFLYTSDVVSDLNLAVDCYKQGAWSYCALTSTFVIFPAISFSLSSRRKWIRLTKRPDNRTISQLKLISIHCDQGWRLFDSICQCDDCDRHEQCECFLNYLLSNFHTAATPFRHSKS